MFGLQMLDVMIGLVFIYVLLALVCTVANEIIAGILDSRTKNLRLGINNLLGEIPVTMMQRVRAYVRSSPAALNQQKSLVEEFYSHPLIKTLSEDGTPPSYIPPATFALSLLDMFAPAKGEGERKVEEFAAGVKDRLKEYPHIQRTLLILIDESGNDMGKLKSNLEGLFNNAMERVSGWYKKKTQIPLLLLAMFFCILSNADSIRIAKNIYNDGALRSAMVAQAEDYARKAQPLPAEKGAATTPELDNTVAEIRKLGIRFGWDNEEWQLLRNDWQKKDGPKEWPFRVVGYLITALAVSLGAPFWFDMLNKMVSIRAVGKSPGEKGQQQTEAKPAQPAGMQGEVK
jgi:hypothetical protein